jgi:hypothetical protein
MRTLRRIRGLAACFLGILTFALGAGAEASITRIAGPTTIFQDSALFMDIDAAFDTQNRVMLVVWGPHQVAGPLRGMFLNEFGAPIGSTFLISQGPEPAGFPKVVYSPEQQTFAVAYTDVLPNNQAARIVRFLRYNGNGGPLFTSDEVTAGLWGGFVGNASGLAYANGRFFVTFWLVSGFPVTYLRVIDAASKQPLGDPILVSDPGDGQSDPEIACDSSSQRCLVVGASYGVYTPGNTPTWGRLIDTSSGLPVGGMFFVDVWGLESGASVTYSAAAGQFLVAYVRDFSSVWSTAVSPAGAVSAAQTVKSTATDPSGGGYGEAEGRIGIAYNSTSQTALLSMSDYFGLTVSQEVTATGAPIPGSTDRLPSNELSPYARTKVSVAVADAASGRFAVVDNQRFYFARAAVYSTSDSLTPPPPPPPPPTPTQPNPAMAIDLPRTGGGVSSSFTVSGWAIDAAASTGTGIDAIHVWAYPNPGSGAPAAFLGVATYGLSRPDVGAVYGARYTNSGYSLTVTNMGPGAYDIVVFAHSVVSNSFAIYKVVRTSVTASMTIDAPASGPIGTFMVLRGWAVDASAAFGTGVDAVHIWAYPNPGSGAAPVFVGPATLGINRPDVAASLGERYRYSGFELLISNLTPGARFDFVAFAHSAATGTFNNWRAIRVTVTTHMWIDLPASGAATGSPFLLAGWALDLAAPAGSGVDAIHVWAYPNPGSGAPPIFLGTATNGRYRPDVAAVFGAQFVNTGYELVAGLAPGVYDVAVFAHSSVGGDFRSVKIVRVIVP